MFCQVLIVKIYFLGQFGSSATPVESLGILPSHLLSYCYCRLASELLRMISEVFSINLALNGSRSGGGGIFGGP